MAEMAVKDARLLLERNGYVVVKSATYRNTQEQRRAAEWRCEAKELDAEHARTWALDCLTSERRTVDRLLYVYGVARAHGATVEELSGTQEFAEAMPR